MPIIGGEPEFTAATTLFTRGSPDATGVVSLFIGPQVYDQDNFSLFTQGPPFIASTLFISTLQNQASGSLGSLYVDGVIGFGGAGYQGYLSLSLPWVNVGASIDSSHTLSVTGPSFQEEIEEETLFIAASTADTVSGDLSFVTTGTDPSSGSPENASNQTQLFIRNATTYDERGATLFIEKEFNSAGLLSLNLQGVGVPTNTLTMFVDGIFTETESTDLYVKGPTLETTTLFMTAWQPN